MREMVMSVKNRWRNAVWIVIMLIVIGMIGCSFIYINLNYAKIREVERINTQVICINNTLKERPRSMSTMKAMIVVLNSNMSIRLDDITTRLDKVDDRLDHIDDILSKLENKIMNTDN